MSEIADLKAQLAESKKVASALDAKCEGLRRDVKAARETLAKVRADVARVEHERDQALGKVRRRDQVAATLHDVAEDAQLARDAAANECERLRRVNGEMAAKLRDLGVAVA